MLHDVAFQNPQHIPGHHDVQDAHRPHFDQLPFYDLHPPVGGSHAEQVVFSDGVGFNCTLGHVNPCPKLHRYASITSFLTDPLFTNPPPTGDRKSTRLNSSHQLISY